MSSDQVSVSPDYAQPTTVKNHYEVLRCFEIVARSHLTQTLAYLLLKAETPAEKTRVGSLTVLKHLVNALKDQLVPHVPSIQVIFCFFFIKKKPPTRNLASFSVAVFGLGSSLSFGERPL